MPRYTFYPTAAGGLAATAENIDLAGDVAAAMHALRLLDDHETATSVVVYCGERKVHTRFRMDPDLKRNLSRFHRLG